MNAPSVDVLILRGLIREQRHWGKFPAIFREENPNARMLAIDLPGIGTERHRPSPMSINGIMEDVRERVLALRQRETPAKHLAIVGLSLSGMLVLEWAHRHPEELSLVVSVNTSARNIGAPWERFAPKLLLDRVFSRGRSIEEQERIALSWTTTHGANDPEAVALFAEIAKTSPVPPRTALAQLFSATRFAAPEQVRVPLWFIVGEGDRLVRPVLSRRLATRMNAGFLSHPTAGHDFTVDEPRWLAQQLRVLLAPFTTQ